tara:strand:+ start:1212 stop:1976 length:765 start_codon:yes stop_codon:yes gene_type:complete
LRRAVIVAVIHTSIHPDDDDDDDDDDDGHRDECPIHRTNETHTHTPKRKRKKERKKVAVVVVDQKTNKQRNKLTDQSPVRHLHERRHGIYLECLTSPCRRPTVWYREQHQQQHPLQKRASINKKVKAFAFFTFLKILLSSSSFRHSFVVHETKQNKVQKSQKKRKKKGEFFCVLSVVYEFGINEEKLVREHSRIHHSFARSFLRGFLFTERRRYKERRRKDDINEWWCHHHHHYHYHDDDDDDDGDEQHKQYSI